MSWRLGNGRLMESVRYMAEKKRMPEAGVCLCSHCGQEIAGNRVYIKTKRGTELYMHVECVTVGRRKSIDQNR